MKTIDQLILELKNLGITLWVEEDKLRYRASKGALTPELKTELKEKKAQLINFLNSLEQVNKKQIPPITPIPRTGKLPLSPTQRNLWFQHHLDPDNAINNMAFGYRLQGKMNLDYLEKSQNEMIRRHEILRSSFPMMEGEPVTVIKEELTLPIYQIDLSQKLAHLSPEQQDQEAFKVVTKESYYAFDLENGPLMAVSVITITPDDHVLLMNFHRMVCDGGSTSIFFQELMKYYEGFLKNNPVTLPDLPIQYVDYAHWSNKFLEGEFLQEKLNYWKKELGSKLPMINLPTDYPRPPMATFDADRRFIVMSPELNQAVGDLSQKFNCTLFMTLVASLNLLLSRYTGKNDILISFSHNGRGEEEVEGLVGAFTKTLPLRTKFSPEMTFRQLLEQVRDQALGADANYNVPFDKLIEDFPRAGNPKRSPFLQIIFSVNAPWRGKESLLEVNFPGLKMSSILGRISSGKTKFDLGLVMQDTEAGLRAIYEYNSNLFQGYSITRMLVCMETLLTEIVKNPDRQLKEYSLITEAEKQELLVNLNQTDLALSYGENIPQQIEKQVILYQKNIAVKDDKFSLTYQELNQKANQMAHYFQSLGITNYTPVAICGEKNCLITEAILAILKVGGIVIPLDLNDKLGRQEKVLKSAEVKYLITLDQYKDNFDNLGLNIISLDGAKTVIENQDQDNLDHQINLEDTAWINYTINAQGEAIGFKLSHHNLLAQSQALAHQLNFKSGEIFYHVSVLPFANIIEALFPALFNGLTVILKTTNQINSVEKFAQELREKKVNILNLVTSFFHQLIPDLPLIKDNLSSDLRMVMVRGEKLAPKAYQIWGETIGDYPLFFNSYGSIATTMTSLIYQLKPFQTDEKLPLALPIGRPLPNTKVYILDDNKLPVPVGVPGEIYLSGQGITQGLDHQENDTIFITNPLTKNPEDQLLKTGDLGRYLADGNIEFRGRIDQEIKMNGVTIQAKEIEIILEKHPQIAQAVVVLPEDLQLDYTPKKVIAYLLAKTEKIPSNSEINNHLKQSLPDYLIPDKFVFLESFPTDEQGKIDRQELAYLRATEETIEKTFIAPQSELEMTIAKIWQEVLQLDQVGINDNFFEIGGQSLLAIKVIVKIQKNLNIDLPFQAILQNPTIASLVKLIENPISHQEKSDFPFPIDIRKIRKGSTKHPLYFVHIEESHLVAPFLEYLEQQYPLYSISCLGEIMTSLMVKRFDLYQELSLNVETIAQKYVKEIIEFQKDKPFSLLGISFGGLVAYEMVQQLTALGKNVEHLILLDTNNSLTKRVKPRIDKRLLRHIKRFMKLGFYYPQSIYKAKVERLKYWLGEKYQQISGKEIIDPQLVATLDILKYHTKLTEDYIPQPYQGHTKISFIRAEDADFSDATCASWQQLTNNQLNIIDVPGTHVGIFEQMSNAKILIDKLEALMN